MARVKVNGKYPYLATWISVIRREGLLIARDGIEEEEYLLTELQAKYLLSMNGKNDPYNIDGVSEEDCEEMFEIFAEQRFFRSGRRFFAGKYRLFTMFVPAKPISKSKIFTILNLLLWSTCLPVLFVGLFMLLNSPLVINDSQWWIGLIVGIIVTTILHECGHMIAAFSVGAPVFEMGLMFRGIIPGGYVFMDESMVKRTLDKAQINLAGIEVNMLTTGICMMLLSTVHSAASPLYCISGILYFTMFQSGIGGLVNLSLIEGLDGEHTISNILGIEKGTIVDCAKANIALMHNPKKRRKYIRKTGINGYLNYLTSLFVMCCQMTLILIIVAEVIVIWGVF